MILQVIEIYIVAKLLNTREKSVLFFTYGLFRKSWSQWICNFWYQPISEQSKYQGMWIGEEREKEKGDKTCDCFIALVQTKNKYLLND